jgi:D-alanyl-lipoteichoic acid acyltransferase DltB (MBOAT superfamily)
MNFSELRFWGLLGLGLIVIGAIRALVRFCGRSQVPGDVDKACLAGLGLFLLLCVSWTTFLIFSAVMLATYIGVRLILKWGGGSPVWLFILIPLQLAPLVYYKYSYFLGSEILHLKLDFLRDLLIPVGISFYTFQKVAFVVDTLALKKPVPRFLDYLNFACFFPQIVAGPIERRDNLLPQMEAFRFRYSANLLNEGCAWVVVGLFFKCCLADNLAEYFDASSVSNPFFIWKANLIFGLRIYYDFAGYSLVALGVARALGVTLTMNFQSPYVSSSAVEFWRRWHVTLSGWFRDYVYIPLGGGKVRWWALNVAIVFLVSGAWHGAAWNFLIWGALHGLFLIWNRLFGKNKIPAFISWVMTMFAVFFAWLCFYETRTGILARKMRTIITPSSYTGDALHEFLESAFSRSSVPLLAFVLMAAGTLFVEWLSIRQRNEPYSILRHPALLFPMVVLIVWLTPGKANDFIYFAF